MDVRLHKKKSFFFGFKFYIVTQMVMYTDTHDTKFYFEKRIPEWLRQFQQINFSAAFIRINVSILFHSYKIICVWRCYWGKSNRNGHTINSTASKKFSFCTVSFPGLDAVTSAEYTKYTDTSGYWIKVSTASGTQNKYLVWLLSAVACAASANWGGRPTASCIFSIVFLPFLSFQRLPHFFNDFYGPCRLGYLPF